jgi:prolyl 4-hydroxylase
MVIALGEAKLRPSTVTIDNGDNSYRTSRTCDLGLLENPYMKSVDEKICKALGIANNYSEVTQLQKYEVGQQFKKHTDYFEPNSGEYRNHASKLGNRTWTFMVYLNSVLGGGGTHFYGLNHTFTAKQGQAVVWNNRLPSGAVNPQTLHAGLPVTEGVKFVITKWFREHPNNA